MSPTDTDQMGVADIRPEVFTASYAGSSTRMDFLFPSHKRVLELKFVRGERPPSPFPYDLRCSLTLATL